jgi:hypothetical protein
LGGRACLHIVDSLYAASPFRFSRVKNGANGSERLRETTSEFAPVQAGENRHTRKAERIAAKFNELVAEYFPNGGYGVMDANRLKLAAAHYVDAETCRDPVTRQRATRCAEYLLSKLKPSSAPRFPAADQAVQALALLFNKPSPDGV